jgi:hypothetical protein
MGTDDVWNELVESLPNPGDDVSPEELETIRSSLREGIQNRYEELRLVERDGKVWLRPKESRTYAGYNYGAPGEDC